MNEIDIIRRVELGLTYPEAMGKAEQLRALELELGIDMNVIARTFYTKHYKKFSGNFERYLDGVKEAYYNDPNDWKELSYYVKTGEKPEDQEQEEYDPYYEGPGSEYLL